MYLTFMMIYEVLIVYHFVIRGWYCAYIVCKKINKKVLLVHILHKNVTDSQMIYAF